MKRMLPEYTFIGHFRDNDYTGEDLYTAILNERIQLLGFESYWLSPMPYVAGSRYENQSEYPRICFIGMLVAAQVYEKLKKYSLDIDKTEKTYCKRN